MDNRLKDISKFAAVLVLVFLTNYILSDVVMRYDMTEDKRYTIADGTIEMLENLEHPVEIEVFLTGDNLNANFQKLQKEVNDKLAEFQAYGGDNFDYYFTDISTLDTFEVAHTDTLMMRLGITGLHIYENSENKQSFTMAYPAAIVRQGNKMVAAKFIKKEKVIDEEISVAQAIGQLEFEIASAVKKVIQDRQKTVAFIKGHGELNSYQLEETYYRLSEFYQVGDIDISTVARIDTFIEAIVLARPTGKFSDQDLYKLDEFINRGGKVIMFLDAMQTRLDSTKLLGIPSKTNINELLFNYGLRQNFDLIQDYTCTKKFFSVGSGRMAPQDWQFYPIFREFTEHPIVKNLNTIYSRDVSTLDTLPVEGVVKTPLVFSSRYSRKMGNPVAFPYDELQLKKNDKRFTGYMPVAYLLEGNFPSYYAPLPNPPGTIKFPLKDKSKETSIIVFSDGDVLLPDSIVTKGQFLPLGIDRFYGVKHSNFEFLRNSLDFVLEEESIQNLRNNDFKPRRLDSFVVVSDGDFWVLINMIAPPLLPVIFFWLIPVLLRRKKQ